MLVAYLEIASSIRELIIKGLLPIGTKLSERKLATKFNTSRSTIASALHVLKDEGYLESNPKSGTIVCNRTSRETSIWEKLITGGMHIQSSDDYKSTSTYLVNSGKKNVTFGIHEEFEPYKPLRHAFKSLSEKKWKDDILNTFDDKGMFILRKTLSTHLANYGIKANPDNIVVFHGYLEAIYTVAAALLGRGTNLYYAHGDMIHAMGTMRSTGTNMYDIPTNEEGPIAAELERLLKAGRNLLYINPVNAFPSGLTYSDKCMDDLLKVSLKYNVPILENDFLRDLWITPPPPPLKARNSDYVIYVGSMANNYVTGARMGWAVLPDYVIRRVCDVKMQMNSGNNSGMELIVNEIISEGYYYDFLDSMRKKLPERINAINAILNKYLYGIAKWNENNLIYTLRLEFDDKIDTNKIIIENPYFIMKERLQNNKNALYTNVLGMSLIDFEKLIKCCAKSINQ